MDETEQLIEALRTRTKPLDIRLDEMGWLVPANYRFGGSFEMGIEMAHPEGPICVGYDRPPRREIYEVPWERDQNLPYPEKKRLLAEVFFETSEWDIMEHEPWLDRDGPARSDSIHSMAIETWLEAQASFEELEPFITAERWPNNATAEFTPGFAMKEQLEASDNVTPHDLAIIDLQIRFSGSPGGGTEGVSIEGDRQYLKKLLVSCPYNSFTKSFELVED